MKVAILFRAVLSPDLTRPLIGGVESYVWELARLCLTLGHCPRVFQLSNEPRQLAFENVDFEALGNLNLWDDPPAISRLLHNASETWRNGEAGITVFALDHYSMRPANPRSIVVQHGVEFDLPLPPRPELDTRRKRFIRGVLESSALGRHFLHARQGNSVLRRQAYYRRQFSQVPFRVCVDHNYVNWLRTQPGYVGIDNYWVVPNFCRVISDSDLEKRLSAAETKKVLYARRFVHYRGVQLMLDILPALLRQHPDASFTFAGEGPLESRIMELASSDSRVRVTRYNPGDEATILADHDISVTPSLGSEGTTLAVAEAMGAGCGVVATDVGGITNMVISGYNGLLTKPTAESVAAGIDRMLCDVAFRRLCAKAGHDTAKRAFSIERWRLQWSEVLEHVGRLGE